MCKDRAILWIGSSHLGSVSQVGFLGYVVYWIRLTHQSHVHTQRINYVVFLDFVIRSWSYMYSEINNKQMKYTKEQHMFVTDKTS
jgi:hypothetical protein